MNKTIIYVTLFLAIVALEGCSNLGFFTRAIEKEQQTPKISIAQSESFNYQDYALILTNYVNDRGLVNYSELKKKQRIIRPF